MFGIFTDQMVLDEIKKIKFEPVDDRLLYLLSILESVIPDHSISNINYDKERLSLSFTTDLKDVEMVKDFFLL